MYTGEEANYLMLSISSVLPAGSGGHALATAVPQQCQTYQYGFNSSHTDESLVYWTF